MFKLHQLCEQGFFGAHIWEKEENTVLGCSQHKPGNTQVAIKRTVHKLKEVDLLIEHSSII